MCLCVQVFMCFNKGRENLSQTGYFFRRISDIRLISNAGYPVSAGYLYNVELDRILFSPDIGYPADFLCWISGIRIVSISGIRPDIENGRITLEKTCENFIIIKKDTIISRLPNVDMYIVTDYLCDRHTNTLLLYSS